MNFSAKLKETRLIRGMSTEELAKKIMISEEEYISYETGKAEPHIYVLRDIAVVLDITSDELLEIC